MRTPFQRNVDHVVPFLLALAGLDAVYHEHFVAGAVIIIVAWLAW